MKEKIKNTLKNKLQGEYNISPNREKSAAILIIGFAILFALVILVRNNYKNENSNNNNNATVQTQTDKEKFLSLDKIFINYLNDYKYVVSINDNDNVIKYEGSVSNNVDNGKKIINNQEIEYHVVNDIAIDLNTNKEITNLYDNYLSYFFVPTNIYEFIKDKEASEDIVDNMKIYIYNNVYKDLDIMFKIVTSKDKIEEVIYKYNNVDYSIKYD